MSRRSASLPPLLSRGETGKIQSRATTSLGRTWTERYSALASTDAAVLGFLAFINDCWRSGTQFDITHPMYETAKGTLGGTPRVNGGSQTGQALIIDGCAASVANWLRAGDLVSIAGLVPVFDVLESVTTDGAGSAVLRLSPPIFAGSSPADNALLTTSGVLLRAMLAGPPRLPSAGADRFITGIELAFAEAP